MNIYQIISDFQTEYQALISDLLTNIVYDIIKIIIGFMIARYLYEKFIMKWLWGGWTISVRNNDKILVFQTIAPALFKRMKEDQRECSAYIKGVVSPYCWLNEDVLSEKAEKIGLIIKDKEQKSIVVDISKNPQSQ